MSSTVFPRIYTNLKSKVCFQFCFQVRRPVIWTIDPYMPFYEKLEIISEIFDSWKFKMSAFFYFWKNSPKNGQIFYLIFKGPPFQYHKVRHPNFLQYTTSWNRFLKFELKKDSFLINFLTKVLWKTLYTRYRKKWNSIFNSP